MKGLFVGMLCLAAVASVLALAYAQSGVSQTGKPGEKEYLTFTGTSSKGDLSEALSAAIRKAEEVARTKGADIMVEYEVEKISGRKGGFAGFNQISVTIRCPAMR